MLVFQLEERKVPGPERVTMTVLPGEGTSSASTTPLPCKRKKLSLKYHSSVLKTTTNTESSMDSMSGITAFFPSSHRIGPFAKYEPEPGRSPTTDDSPASEATSSSERNANPPVIATLANLGNTCFLNSVLYTLRFAPQFMHQLHHLVTELGSLRPPGSSGTTRPQRTHMAVERLHELYQALRGIEETKDMSCEPLQPSVFLMAFREVNPMFETHQQHDAHELLVCLLDNVRETCLQLAEARKQAGALALEPSTSGESKASSTRSGAFKTPWSKNGKKRKAKAKEEQQAAVVEATPAVPAPPPSDPNFIAKDFEGVTVLRTTCLECESVTERKETFCDICVPISTPQADAEDGEVAESEVFRSALLSSEFISGTNKYWCEECKHYNEAQRCTRYESLPRILTLQLKRFSSTFGSMFSVSKVNDFMPTPLTLNCFCESCCKTTNPSSPTPLEEEQEKPEPEHSYQLFAAIMHLGATMASGHYVSFVRASDNVLDYCNCETHQANFVPPSNSGGSGGGILKFLKPKVEKANISSLGANVCPGTDCCGVRMSIEQGADVSVPEPSWLECDDDNVTVMTRSDFEDILSSKRSKYSSLTPYLLFYVRSP